ncbi:hypothetical protein AAV94_11315 [Lampropedia cohaerens]|uniref:EamA domain-containing protein n=1 Tax=Lampropedia cohaerens TaxID=1610491 RepID=A0A0U1PY11_9BURK|nr:EamA family transporter RarD [Lampropedia cohaerens]KKW67413.1 hypothetical protein AAV94_11315 [Lampropedia cohaerens]
MPQRSEAHVGLMYALAAYGSWGLMTIYWKCVSWMPSLELIAHRVLWTVVLMVPLLVAMGNWRELLQVMRHRRLLGILFVTAALISVNWLGFVWAVNSGRVLQASLGYFINPLLSVLLGVALLGERLRVAQWLAIALAGVGVLWLVIWQGEVPWIGLMLAGTFAVYGLLRKFTPVSATVGLTVESALIAPIALGYLLWSADAAGGSHFLSHGWGGAVLVALSGVLTAAPLLWFANAARRLSLTTLGLVQYVAPTTQLLLGVFAFHENFTVNHLIAFGWIWAGLAVFSAHALLRARR